MLRKFSTFVDLLSYRALHQPDKIAFTFLQDEDTELGSLTYQALEQQARAIAQMLVSINAQGERVLLLYPPGLDFICAFFGCLYAGVIATPAYPPRPNRSLGRVQTIVADAQAKFALTTKSLLANIESRFAQSEIKDIHCLHTDKLPLHLASDWQKQNLQGENLAFLQYTSGSTGEPKGVMVSHGNLLHNSSLINQCFQDTRDSQGVSWLPPYHDMGLIGGVLQPIYVGASMTLMSPVTFLQRPLRWLKAISRYRATTSGGPNFAYDLCVNQITPEQKASLDLGNWQLAFTGAEPVRTETIERFAAAFATCGFRKEAFYPCYGMAETTLIVSGGVKDSLPISKTVQGEALELNKVIAASSSELGTKTLVGCGQRVGEQQIIIVNPDTLTCAEEDEVGEIWVSGESIAQGYWRKAKQTQATFQAYLADSKEGPFLRTGDLGFLQKGELFVTGRLKDLIIIRGRNHYPQDIELTIDNSHPAVRQGYGAAFAVEVKGEERLVIAQEIKRSYLRNLDAEPIINAIRKEVVQQHELRPFAILLLKTGTIPKTSSGKIRRHACQAGFSQKNLNVVGEWREVRTDLNKLHQESYKSDKSYNSLSVNQDKARVNNNQDNIQSWLVTRIAQKLGISPQEIDVREPFASYGLDSLQAVSLSAELEDWLGIKLSPTLVYDYPTIETLATYLSAGEIRTKLSPSSANSKLKTGKEAIAIIGIGCRFPGAKNPEEFWQLLRGGEDAITQVKGRWEGDGWGGFLEEVDLFDPQFFGISPREAQRMDPQQRLLLEVSWEALENAGIAADKLAGSATGVFVGISSSDYSQLQLHYGSEIDAYAGTGNAHSIAANRLSYLLDFRGPSLTIDTACSSSLVALHLACQSLYNRECHQAIAGGVNLMLSPELTLTFSQAGMMSPDGRCKTFDASADGYVRGEGCGVVILKRLSDAIREQDNILAVIRGSAVNQDGRSNGLTAPNGLAQQEVIRQAIANAQVEAADISYVEAHGTGTSLGDPIEVNSLKAVLTHSGDSQQPCSIGSVKTNIGHLEAAAGIAGLIKIVLSLQHQEIPPHLHFQQLNPHIDLEDTSLLIPTKLQPWIRGEKPRLAGVSSFGFGGTNAHIILGEGKESESNNFSTVQRPLHLLTLSGKSETALGDLVKSYEEYLTSPRELLIEDICFTANTGRSHFKHRLAIVAESREELLEGLKAYSHGQQKPGLISNYSQTGTGQKIAFLFTGQGSQYVDMGYQLYQTQPIFRQVLDNCAQILDNYLEQPLLEVLYPQLGNGEVTSSLLDETIYTQPALFSLEYALAKLWQSWGIEPDIVMGHSVGEYVAACIGGVFSLEDGLKLIAERGRLMQQLSHDGEMVAVFAEEGKVKIAIEPYNDNGQIAIAAFNGSHIVISGAKKAVNQAVATLKSQGIKTKQLKVSHAFHSPLMQPMLEDFAQVAKGITYSSPKLKIISNVTGLLAQAEIATPQYWVNHVIQPVQFAPSMELLQSTNYQIFLEIGAQPTLLGMGRHCLPSLSGLWLPSLRSGQDNWQTIIHSLATLYSQGIKIDWVGFDQGYQRQRLNLPTYPFQRQRYWLEQKNSLPQYQQLITSTSINDCFYQIEWHPQTLLQADYNSPSQSSWLIFADQGGIGESLAQQLQKQGHQYLLIYRGENYTLSNHKTGKINPAKPEDFQHLLSEVSSTFSASLTGIIHLWSLDAAKSEELTISALEQAQINGCGSTLYLVQALTQKSLTAKLWLVTRGTQPIDSQLNSLAIAQSPLWGMGRVIAGEHPEIWGGIIDLALQPGENESLSLLKEITNSGREDQIAFANQQRYVARLVNSQKIEPHTSTKISSDCTYLITGGLGALGLQLAQWMVKQGAKYLVLLGRSGAKSSSGKVLDKLQQTGAKILVAQADISQTEELIRVLAEIKTSLPQLKGIIHTAGVLDDGILQSQNWERFTKVIAPKIQGTWNLHHLTQDLSLDFFVLFSSVASILGSPGQSNYAAANTFIDALAHYRQAQGLPALSINWGPWEGSGMVASTPLLAKGLNLIKPEEGLKTFSALLTHNQPQIGVLPVQWTQLSQQFPSLLESPYFSEIVADLPVSATKAVTQNSSIFKQLLELNLIQKEEFLTTYLQTSLAHILQIPVNKLSLTESLLDVGMDSLMVMEAINQLKNDLQLMLYPREFYERPRINSLAKYLAIEFEHTHLQNFSIKHTNSGSKLVITPQTQKTREQTNKSQSKLPKLPGIVFILSSPRSGSTLLRVMLAGHQDLSSPPELHLLPFTTMVEREETLALSHLGEGLQRAFMELKGIDAQQSQSLVADLVKQNLSIQEVYALLQKLAGKRLLVDKSPTYASSRETLERAEELFENPKYIHLVRHPYAMIESFCRMRMDKLVGSTEDNPYQVAESIWEGSNQNILDFLAQIDSKRHHQVSYEELVQKPQKVMEELCQFLNIPFTPSLLNPYEGKRMTDGVYNTSMSLGDPNFLRHNQIDSTLGKTWKNIKLPHQLGVISRRLSALLNYELPFDREISLNIPLMKEHYLDIRGLDLCLCSWGQEDAPLVLCLHGILEQGAAWLEVAGRLAAKGYRVVAPDLRGHGRSSHVGKGGSYNLIDFLGDIDAIVEQLTDKAFTMVGHSLGSVIAAMFTSIRPQKVENLVLVETILPSEAKDDEATDQLATHLDYLASPPEHPVFPDIAAAAERLCLATPSLSKSLAIKLAERITEPCAEGVCWRWASLLSTRAGIGFNGIGKSRYLGLLRRIKAPITLIYGNKSNFNRQEDLSEQKKAMPAAKKIILPGGHNLHLEAPLALAQVIGKLRIVNY